MKLRPTSPCARAVKPRGFTLAEVLAALMFMAIVIPVAVQGLRLANLAGQVGQRKAAAGRIAERVLNELLVTGEYQKSAPHGIEEEGPYQFHWQARLELWSVAAMQLLSVQVKFQVQGLDYDVNLSTVVEASQ